MDAVIVLAFFVVIVGIVWALGAHGLAVILTGCGVVSAIVESVWYLRYRKIDPGRRTVSKEAGRLSPWRLAMLSLILLVATVGLIIHFWSMR